MEARQAQGADWEALRQLRLRALADAPDAFASTLEAEVAFPAEVWRQRAEGGPAAANFIARQGGLDIGLAAVFAEPDAPGRMHLVSMWVDPGYRRRGVARALVGQVVRWAADRRPTRWSCGWLITTPLRAGCMNRSAFDPPVGASRCPPTRR
jgi:GNAT superfamily N-acetyltransferase